jgi:hypothetical protein
MTSAQELINRPKGGNAKGRVSTPGRSWAVMPGHRAGGKAPHPDVIDAPPAAVPRLILASLLFAAALIRTGGPILLTAVLSGIPAVLAIGLGDSERAVS